MKNLKIYLSLCLISINVNYWAFGQSLTKKEMQKLQHFVGDWVGTSMAFEQGDTIRKIPAYEKISYKVDGHVLTIDLYSESLKLHTVVYYDPKDKVYYYNPYYDSGTAKYTAKLKDGRLIVSPSESKRFIFEITEDGKFREYGETFENGEWILYFEDVFKRQ